MNDLGPISTQAVDILSTILASLIIATIILRTIYDIVKTLKTKEARKNYTKNLTDHEKAIIKDYENLEWSPFRKAKK